MERQSFLDRMQLMEIALDNLNAEKDDLMEKKCKEIRDLKAEMEAMEKQLQSNKKFIEEQAQEREQEREEYLKELSKMQEHVREKEKIQSNEAQLRKEIESLEQDLRLRIEDHQNTMQKKDAIEIDLRQYVDKVNDLRDIIAEFEEQLQLKSKIEIELRQKLANLTETVNDQERRNSLLGDEIALSKTKVAGIESTEQVQTLKEKLACQSQEIEEMSQNQTLLQELRGQIHFLEAKVEQRAKQLEALHLSSNSPFQSADASPSSQDSESIHLPCEDGWEMSPRSIHWLEMRRLEEKIGRLVHIDEELIKKNKDLEQKLKQLQNIHSECEQENSILQEKLTEQMIQVSTLKSHMDEQKHKPPSPHASSNISKKLEELQDAYQAVTDKNKELFSELRDAKAVCQMLQEEIAKKDNKIASLQINTDSALKEKENLHTETSCFKLILLEKEEDLSLKSEMIESLQKELLELQNNKLNSPEIQKEMVEKDKEIEVLKTENAELKSLAEKLKGEIISLKDTLENSKKELDIEKVQIETLYDELGTLSEENKRLEEDLETVQNMMQQKERELATLHEETDAEIKLQAEFEALEKQFESQKAVEQKLSQRIQELEGSLETMKSKSDQWESHKNKLEKSHQMEIQNLKGQLNALKKCISSDAPEDIDLTVVKKEIVEAAKMFNLKNATERKGYEDLVYKLLKKSVDNKQQQIQRKFEVDIDNINISWRQKIESEVESMNTLCEKYKKDYLLLQERTNAETDKLCKDRDSFWQSKLQEIENSLKKEISEKHSKEFSFLQSNFEKLSKEKTLCEKEVKLLSQQVAELKVQKEKIFKEFQERLPLLEHKLKERLEAQWKQKEAELRQEIQLLQEKLGSALQRETAGQLRHKDEIAELHKIFEARWREEVKKIVNLQSEELQKLKNSKEQNLEEVYQHLVVEYGKKLEAFQKEYAKQIKEERKLFETRHQNNLMEIQNTLEKRFEEEKRIVLNAKDRELAALTEALEERKKEITDLKCLIQNTDKKYWEEEKQRLISKHEKEISELKQKLKSKYEKLLQNHLQARDDDMKKMEEAYNERFEEVSELMKIAKQAATGSLHAESGSLRTSTPPSEITSSDEACSSCQEDMLIANKHLLVNKIHQDGKRLLNLINSSHVTSHAEKEYLKWLEEREWIIEKLKNFDKDMVNGQMNLKSMLNNICSELYESRKKIDGYVKEINTLKHKCSELEGQISEADSKLYILASNLSHQAKLNAELDSLLSTKTNEVDELKKRLKENGFTTSKSSLQQYSQQYSTPTSSSYSVEQLRSADNISSRPADKFASFLPEIDSPSPIKLSKTTEELYPESVKSLIEITDEILKGPDSSMRQEYDHQSMNINQELLGENEINSSYYAKIHGLYWVYRKSLSQNRSLKYQKKYLLMLIRGFQLTEKVTLSCVNQIGKNIVCETGSCTSSVSEQPLKGCKLFRTVAFVIVAIQRMKFYVKRWRLFAKVPETEIINAEVQSVFQNYHQYPPTTMFCSFNSSLLSLSSKSTSVYESEQIHNIFNSSASSISSRTGTKSKRRPKYSQSQLSEYVQRLDNLQKTLGLNNQI